MIQQHKRFTTVSGLIFILLSFSPVKGNCQNVQHNIPSERVRECFDFNWLFHKGDIAIKNTVKAGKYGGLTDISVNIVTDESTEIDYTNVKKPTAFKPADWQKVDLPHDWLVEETFVNDNSLGSQPAATGFLPTGIGFYRKEFEIPRQPPDSYPRVSVFTGKNLRFRKKTKGRKYPLNLMEFTETAVFG